MSRRTACMGLGAWGLGLWAWGVVSGDLTPGTHNGFRMASSEGTFFALRSLQVPPQAPGPKPQAPSPMSQPTLVQAIGRWSFAGRSEEHTSELQSLAYL